MIVNKHIDVIGNHEGFALVSPNTLQYFNLNSKKIEASGIKLSKELVDVNLVIADPFGQYVLLISDKSIHIVYFDARLCPNQIPTQKSNYEVQYYCF